LSFKQVVSALLWLKKLNWHPKSFLLFFQVLSGVDLSCFLLLSILEETLCSKDSLQTSAKA
jgi:hypothetical protein